MPRMNKETGPFPAWDLEAPIPSHANGFFAVGPRPPSKLKGKPASSGPQPPYCF